MTGKFRRFQWTAVLTLSMLALAACSQQRSEAVPNFDHIIWIVFENRSYDSVIGSPDMPYFNALATQNVLLTRYFGVRHPSLPNYLALIGGDTFGVTEDCTGCYLDETSLPDLLEAAGRTWKTYQEDMPSPCATGDTALYAQKHNPFVYFDAIRTNERRCQQSVVSFTELEADLRANTLPDFAFITPNLCHSGHDCDSTAVDAWLAALLPRLQNSPAFTENSLIVVTYDEGKAGSWFGRKLEAGGHIAAVLISPRAKPAVHDDTYYNHYSLLKTLLLSWDLPPLGKTGGSRVRPITGVWK